MTTRAYLVIAEAVYDHGVLFVSHSEAAALAFTEKYAPDADGHHGWRIEEVRLDTPLGPGEFEKGIALTEKAHA